jgi:hypothetical protein
VVEAVEQDKQVNFKPVAMDYKTVLPGQQYITLVEVEEVAGKVLRTQTVQAD